MKNFGNIILYVILIIVIMFYIVPFIVLLSTSLKPESQVLTKTWEWIPRTITFENYSYVIDHFPFIRWTLNSIIVTSGTILITCLISLPAGYAFARFNFKGKNFLFIMSLLTIMIPINVLLPQLYLWFFYLKMINTHICLMIPLSTSAIGVFLFRQFISQIPRDIEDAAKIDGCGYWGIFFRIILPLTKPAITTIIIFTGIKSWIYLIWPLIAASDDTVKTLPVGLALNIFASAKELSPPYEKVMAATILSIILPVILFIFLQKYFVKGIATTGLKE